MVTIFVARWKVLMKQLMSKYSKIFPKQNLTVTAAIAVIVGLIVCFEASSLFSKKKPSINSPRFLVARRDLPSGHPISLVDLALAGERSLKEMPRGAMTDQDLHLLKGAYLKQAISEGSVVALDALNLSASVTGLGVAVPKGKRACRLRAESGMEVRPGERIDILLVPKNIHDMPILLVEGALIIQAGEARGEEPRNLVVAVSRVEVAILEKAEQRGKLKIVLRNPGDRFSAGSHSHSLLRVHRGRPKVEIIE